jgi:CHAD domain-containing protein
MPSKEPKNATRAANAVAGERIIKAYTRLVRRASELDDDSPAAEVHRLRIEAKKLRYLLECFRTLFPEKVIEPQIGKLKKLQNALGGFNDMAVQQRYLAELKGELEPEVNTDTIRAIDRLAADLADRQQEHRDALHDRLQSFVDESTWLEFGGVFSADDRA